ncbi:MAG TPA: helix-turn-helix transcriptional regulator [Sphaerochaeta sp.]|nr:helix-turn-helix transcriptional regulator [Spirochaetota bacterium]HOR80723.1 helix-turn-helix transcriptional regulator [Sphaerochaeta sp.]HPK64448.1 helix-turn-helix transcriptional regulator [Sphaerochaeta sp.]
MFEQLKKEYNVERTYTLQDIFARNLKERRRKLGLTQAKLAGKIGVSTSFITEIETSRKAPSFSTIEKIGRALEVPCWTFFCEDGDKFTGDVTVMDQFAYRLKQDIAKVIDQSLSESR